MSRASRPLPPSDVKLDGAYFPATVANSPNVAITWKRRSRPANLSGTDLSQDNSTVDTPESGVNYFVRHGFGALRVDTDMGTGTSFNVTLIFPGLQTIEIFSRKDGLDSFQRLTLEVDCLAGTGVVGRGALPTVTLSAPGAEGVSAAPAAMPTIVASGPTAGTSMASGALPTFTISGPTAIFDTSAEAAMPTITVSGPTSSGDGGVPVDARVTEADIVRVTEDGLFRVLERVND